MKYAKIYEQLIERARNRKLSGYVERHHIVPRCMFGTDSPENLVELTPEEHYVAHQLLVRIHPENRSLIYACMMMASTRNNNNRIYGWVRRRYASEISLAQTSEGNSQFGTRWVYCDALKLSKKLDKCAPLPEGYTEGRRIKFDNKKCSICSAPTSSAKAKYCDLHRREVQKEYGRKNIKKIAHLGPDSYRGRKFITNGTEDKTIHSSEILPDGWRYGRSNNKRKSGVK